MFGNLGEAKKYLGQAAKMLIGIPDYDNYVEHMQTNHPDKPYMTYEEFFPRTPAGALWRRRQGRSPLLLKENV